MVKDANIGKIIESTVSNLMKEISGGKVRHKSRVMDNLIAFVGAAGGAGTSTIVANLAYTLNERGLTVLILDLNILYPVQHVFFRLKQGIDKKDLVSFLLGRSALGESIDSVGDISIMMAHNRNIMDYINCDNETCSKNLDAGIERLRELFDVILVDCPLNIHHDVINTVMYKADSIYVVWDENVACIGNMEKLRRNFSLSGIEAYSKVRVVMNKRTNVYYSTAPFKTLKVDLVSTFPFEKAVIESGLNGEVFCQSGASKSETADVFAKEMNKLADKVLEIGGYIGG